MDNFVWYPKRWVMASPLVHHCTRAIFPHGPRPSDNFNCLCFSGPCPVQNRQNALGIKPFIDSCYGPVRQAFKRNPVTGNQFFHQITIKNKQDCNHCLVILSADMQLLLEMKD